MGSTQGTYTVDSDIFAMGSDLVIDLMNFNSTLGKCKILIRGEVQHRITEGSENWTVTDVILFSALSGCDFISRLFHMRTYAIEELMQKYKDSASNQSLDELLSEFASGQSCSTGKK